MKVYLLETVYEDGSTYVSPKGEAFEVTDEEYSILKQVYDIGIVVDKDQLLKDAKRVLAEREYRQRKYREDEERRKEKAAKAAATRKAKQLEKLKKELGVE